MKRILSWLIDTNPLVPFMFIALGMALIGQSVSYDVVIP